ncbi:restriction endonuclease subunit S [Gemella morbillorum]|uniref:restriction endonuclease subunit S n=1 Tax=Gemella morbillorum TaxID=29391 RepID=UPI001CB013D1|nr:restriction endonuclease subunit S [Gemella morbillorum]MBF1212585.1 restriction endonuclease subunit S [Gemella morbillorum]
MSKLTLDSVEWGEFFIGGKTGLFDITSTSSGIDKNKLNQSEGNIPYITRSEENNGINLFVSDEQNSKYQKDTGGVITIGLDTQTVFYQPQEFYTGQNIQILKNEKLSKFSSLFIIPLLKIQMEKFNWGGNGATLTRLKRTRIVLPIDSNGNPNWQFMEDYIKQEMREQSKKVASYYENKLMKLGFELLDLEVEWKDFWMEDILDISSGVRLTKADQVGGDMPFIGASDANNGVTEFVGNTNKSLDSNVLGVNYNGSVVENFYHSYECIFSDDVKRVKFKDKEYGDEFTYLFLKQMILSQKNKYQYGYKFNAKRMSRQKIMLPINKNGEPHWEYMSNFVKKLEKENTEKTLNYIYIYIMAKKLENKYLLKNTLWKEFFIEDICEIKSGKDIYERDRIDGQTPYVTATANNNGIGYFISNTNVTLQEKCISVNRNGSVGYSFYHSYPALFGNDTRKLIPKYNDDYVAKFISFMISSQKEKYGYGYKMGTARLKRQKILLPINEDEAINYEFMKKYILIQEIISIYSILDYYKQN